MSTPFNSRLRITSQPRLAKLASSISGAGIGFRLDRHLEAVGTIAFDHARGSTAGWQIGFIQAQWIETNWAVYRGMTQAAGSVFVQRGRPPARPQQACRDAASASTPFYARVVDGIRTPIGGTASIPFVANLPPSPSYPSAVEVLHSDLPRDRYPYIRTNMLTGQINLLRQAQLEFSFCTMFAAIDPAGTTHFLRGFYWNVNWQADLGLTSAGMIVPHAVPGGNSCNVGGIFEGGPTDPRFLTIMTKPQPVTCNIVAQAATLNPNIKEAAGWPSFDVRR